MDPLYIAEMGIYSDFKLGVQTDYNEYYPEIENWIKCGITLLLTFGYPLHMSKLETSNFVCELSYGILTNGR